MKKIEDSKLMGNCSWYSLPHGMVDVFGYSKEGLKFNGRAENIMEIFEEIRKDERKFLLKFILNELSYASSVAEVHAGIEDFLFEEKKPDIYKKWKFSSLF